MPAIPRLWYFIINTELQFLINIAVLIGCLYKYMQSLALLNGKIFLPVLYDYL